MNDTVRIAGPEDEDRLFDLLWLMQTIGPVARMLPASPPKVMQQIQAGTRTDPKTRTVSSDLRQGLIGVIDLPHDSRLAASIGLFFNWWWYTEAPILSATWLYVLPSHRRRRYDELLFEWALAQHKDLRERMRLQFAERGEDATPLMLDLSYIADGRFRTRDRLWGRHAKRIGSLFIVGMPD